MTGGNRSAAMPSEKSRLKKSLPTISRGQGFFQTAYVTISRRSGFSKAKNAARRNACIPTSLLPDDAAEADFARSHRRRLNGWRLPA